MQVVMKMPHIEVKVKGPIPKTDVKLLKQRFSALLKKYEESADGDEYVDIYDTDWYGNIKQKRSPGNTVRIYRQNAGLTQKELGIKLDGFSAKYISDIENNRRLISKETAKKLSKLFKISINRLI